jgi:type VI protein secretion system component Hcp
VSAVSNADDYVKNTGDTITGDLTFNQSVSAIKQNTSSNYVLSLQSMGNVEVVIDNNNNDSNKSFDVKKDSQSSTPIFSVNESGKTSSDGGYETGNFEIVHNSNTDSLDFNYIG